jgi:hypothetical protein
VRKKQVAPNRTTTQNTKQHKYSNNEVNEMAITKVGLRFRRTLSGGPPAMDQVPLVATAYYDGNVLRVNATTGSACLAKTLATSAVAYVMNGNVSNGNSSTGKWPVYIINDDTVFEARMAATGARQARVTDLSALRVGTTYNYRLSGTAGPFRIVGVHPDDVGGTGSNGRFYVTGGRSQYAAYGRTTEA